jgi:hypothetical protein
MINERVVASEERFNLAFLTQITQDLLLKPVFPEFLARKVIAQQVSKLQ